MTRRAVPLGDWIAVEPENQGEDYGQAASGLWLPQTRRNRGGDDQTLRGMVLAFGRSVPDQVRAELQVGGVVLYERHSAHPHQDVELDAGLFGGTPGRFAVLIRVEFTPPEDVLALDLEIERRTARLFELARAWADETPSIQKLREGARPVFRGDAPEEVLEEATELQRKILEAKRQRRGGQRSRLFVPVDDRAMVSRGIVAVA